MPVRTYDVDTLQRRAARLRAGWRVVTLFPWVILAQFVLADALPAFITHTVLWQLVIVYPLLSMGMLALDRAARRRLEPMLESESYRRCHACFYPLEPERASGDTLRCPECGELYDAGRLRGEWRKRLRLSERRARRGWLRRVMR